MIESTEQRALWLDTHNGNKIRTVVVDGYVYVLRSGPYVKIGRTNNLTRRFAQLDVQLPFPTEHIWTIPADNAKEAERLLHEEYDHLRVNGEWFEMDYTDAQEICLNGVFAEGRFIHRGWTI